MVPRPVLVSLERGAVLFTMVDLVDPTGDDADQTTEGDATIDDASDPEVLPRRLGRYTLLERIGAGGTPPCRGPPAHR